MKTVATAAALAMLALVATLGCSPVSVARAASGAVHPLEPLSAAELQRTHGLVGGHFMATGLPTDSRFLDFPGTWVFHRHILGHEDGGMMSVIQVS